jgi:hypothetical protein
MRRSMRRSLTPVVGTAFAAIIVASACTRPTTLRYLPVELNGTWAISASNVSGDGITCGVSGLSVTLVQSSETAFTGTALGGLVTCDYQGTITRQPVDSGTAVVGTLDGRVIEISVPSEGATLDGTVAPNDDQMSGTTQLQLTLGGGLVVTINGNWSGTRLGS